MHPHYRVCTERGVGQRLTEPYQPWTNGQAIWMNRTIKDATINVLHHANLAGLRARPRLRRAHNIAEHLKAIRSQTLFDIVCELWTNEPSRFHGRLASSRPGADQPIVSLLSASRAGWRPTGVS